MVPEGAAATTLSAIARTSAPYSVAIVDDDQKLRTRLAMQLGDAVRVASFATIEDMEEKFPAGNPLVVVFGPTYADQTGLKDVEAVVRYRPEIGSVMVVDQLSTH